MIKLSIYIDRRSMLMLEFRETCTGSSGRVVRFSETQTLTDARPSVPGSRTATEAEAVDAGSCAFDMLP